MKIPADGPLKRGFWLRGKRDPAQPVQHRNTNGAGSVEVADDSCARPPLQCCASAPDLIQSEQEKIVVDLRRLGAPKPLSDIGDPRSELARLRNKESSGR